MPIKTKTDNLLKKWSCEAKQSTMLIINWVLEEYGTIKQQTVMWHTYHLWVSRKLWGDL